MEIDDYVILSPSYKRSSSCFTQKYIKKCLYVVMESEAEEYLKNGHKIMVCPDSAQGNVSRIRNWILENSPKKNLVILDDDIKSFGRFNGNKPKKMNEEEFYEFLESAFILVEESGAKFWGVNCIGDKGSYREYTPFSLSNFIGGPFQGHILDHDLRYDESLPLKEDYDMVLQQLNKYRKVFRFNFIHYFAKMHENIGGCASYRTLDREKQQMKALRRKWGGDIIKVDSGSSKVNRKSENLYDINPIMRAPIKGI